MIDEQRMFWITQNRCILDSDPTEPHPLPHSLPHPPFVNVFLADNQNIALFWSVLLLSCQGYSPTIFYPKRPNKTLFNNLVTQCQKLDITFLEKLPKSEQIDADNNFVLDAVFGFSFKGNVRAPFDSVLETMKEIKAPLCAIDVPSGELKV